MPDTTACTNMLNCYTYQDSLVVSCKAKMKQHVHAQPTRLPLLFTASNAVKFPSAVTQSPWALPLRYYRASTFLPCRISKPKMNKLGTTVVKNQPFQLLWLLFLYLRFKLDCLESNSVVTKELILLFYVESAKQHSLESIKPPLLRGLQ